MTVPAQAAEKDVALRCTSKFNGARCSLRSGHHGSHWHEGAAGSFRWGARRRKR